MKFKVIFAFILGAASGAGGMYLFMKDRIRKELEEENAKKINAELESIRNGACIETEKEVVNEKPVEEPKRPTEEDLEKYEKVLKKVDYTKVPQVEPTTSFTDAVTKKAQETIETAEKKVGKKPKVPKKVTQDEFDATPEDERTTLIFYADGVLADEDDNVYDPTETMGATNFKNFKTTYDTVYIFNYARNFMYEVIQSNSKYSDIIGGDLRN